MSDDLDESFNDEDLILLDPADTEPPTIEDVEEHADNWCEICQKPGGKNARALAIHMGKYHKEAKAQSQPKTAADVIDSAISSSAKASKVVGKLNASSTELLAKCLAVGLMWLVIRYINSTRQPPLDEQEEGYLFIGEDEARLMFRPVFDIIGQNSIASNAINKITKHKDYVACGTLWYQYYMIIAKLAKEREIRAPQPTVKREEPQNGFDGPIDPTANVVDFQSGDQFIG